MIRGVARQMNPGVVWMSENTQDMDLILACLNDLNVRKGSGHAGVEVWKSDWLLAAVLISFFLESIFCEIYLATALHKVEYLVTNNWRPDVPVSFIKEEGVLELPNLLYASIVVNSQDFLRPIRG